MGTVCVWPAGEQGASLELEEDAGQMPPQSGGPQVTH
jgi:hypothetical protein